MIFRFIGKDGSLGFKKGNIYDLQLNTTYENSLLWITYRGFQIPYQSIGFFLKNWEELK